MSCLTVNFMISTIIGLLKIINKQNCAQCIILHQFPHPATCQVQLYNPQLQQLQICLSTKSFIVAILISFWILLLIFDIDNFPCKEIFFLILVSTSSNEEHSTLQPQIISQWHNLQNSLLMHFSLYNCASSYLTILHKCANSPDMQLQLANLLESISASDITNFYILDFVVY